MSNHQLITDFPACSTITKITFSLVLIQPVYTQGYESVFHLYRSMWCSILLLRMRDPYFLVGYSVGLKSRSSGEQGLVAIDYGLDQYNYIATLI